MQRNESRHRYYVLHNIELKMDKRAKCKIQKYKPLEDDIGEHLENFGIGDDFLDTTLKVWAMKEKIGKLDFI